MAYAPRPPGLPVRQGVSPSSIALPSGPWALTLDFLAERLPALSRAGWHQRMADGEVVRDDGTPVPPHAPFLAQQRLHYWRRLDEETPMPVQAQVLFQDAHLVVVDKPHYLPVTPSGRFVQNSVLVRLRQQLDLPELSPIHRIDRDTAGIVVLSARAAERAAYQNLFRDRMVHKAYEAVVHAPPAGTLPAVHRSRLVADADFFTMHEAPGEANSETHCQVLSRFTGPAPGWGGPHTPRDQTLCWVGLQPVSGKRHQLRAHLSALGAPILGDPFYPRLSRAADAPDDLAAPMQLLARSLRFADPVTGEARAFRSALHLTALPPGA